MGTAAQYCYERSPIISCVGGRRDAGKYKQAVLTGAWLPSISLYLLAGRISRTLHGPRIITDEDISWKNRARGNEKKGEVREEGGRGRYNEGWGISLQNKACDRSIEG